MGAIVETTAGPIEAGQLGRTMAHEHLFIAEDAVRMQWPHVVGPVEELLQHCICKIEELRQLGVDTICDPSCLGMGRDVSLNIAVTEATGMRFVMATGIYPMEFKHLPWNLREQEVLVDYFVHDIEIGIQNTDVKAGFIKCAADAPGMEPQIVTLHEAAAEACIRTNVPIMAHSNPTVGVGLDQMRLFIDAGVDPSWVQIAHVGDTSDLDYIERLLATGCYIGLDRYGFFGPSTEERNATLLALLERGYGDRITLGTDAAMKFAVLSSSWKQILRDQLPTWHSSYLLEHVVPALRRSGVLDEQIDAMLGSNVHAWLSKHC